VIRRDQTWSDIIRLEISVNFFLWTAITNFDRTCPLPGRLARQNCLADLPGRLARQTCPADLPGRLSRQTCPADLPGRLARQSCPAVLLWQGSPALTRHTCKPWLWQYSVIMNRCSHVAWNSDIQGVPLHMGFIVKNPSKRSVSLKNGLEKKKWNSIQCTYFGTPCSCSILPMQCNVIRDQTMFPFWGHLIWK
jgi:hypothetical protein